MHFLSRIKRRLSLVTAVKLIAGVGIMLLCLLLHPNLAHAAACTAPPTDYGTDTLTVNIPLTSTYRTWSRIMAPDTTNNTYLLEVDGSACYSVGGGNTIPANTWTWVNYQDATTSSTIDINLTAGSHTLKLIGNAPDLEIDRLILTGDMACVPTGTGDNCAAPPDTTPPTVSISAPTNGATISGTSNITATASDDVGVTKVEFYIDGTLMATDTSPSYSYSWDTTTASNASHSLTAKAYDAANNVTTSTAVSVTVNNIVTPPYDNRILVRPDGRAYYVEGGRAHSIGNPAIRDCIIVRHGTGSWLFVANTVIDNSYSASTQTYCNYEQELGLNFIEESGDPTVWLVHAGGTKSHVGRLCVVDPYTTVLKKFHLFIVPRGETYGHTQVADFWADPTACGQLPG